jgi:peptidoglycan-associated lipoprotein
MSSTKKKISSVAAALLLGLGALWLMNCESNPEKSEAKSEVAPEASPTPTQEAAAPEIDLTVQTVHFDFDSAALSAEAKEALKKVADYLDKDKGASLIIAGHCDERGSQAYNTVLGLKRAEAVKAALVELGVDAARLTTESFGEDKPLDPGHDEAAWAKNRRSEFVKAQ